jgi:predicted enzyme related to lactoylglutathione lyase
VVRILLNIDVDDLEKAIEFYRTGLGLALKRRLFDGTVAEMAGATSAVYLLKKAPGSRASAEVSALRDYRRHWTPIHLDVAVDDLPAAVQRAQGAGAIAESEMQTYPWGRIAFMSDPFGHGFCLLEFSGQGYDAVTT